MADVRIIAVSLDEGQAPNPITHVWTIDGALSVQRVVEALWRGRTRFHVVLPSGRVDVVPVPARGPGWIDTLLGRRVRGRLASPRGAALKDSLLTLPRLPSPTRPRRSRAMPTTDAA